MTGLVYTSENLTTLDKTTRWSHHQTMAPSETIPYKGEANRSGTSVILRRGGREAHQGIRNLSRKRGHHRVRPTRITTR